MYIDNIRRMYSQNMKSSDLQTQQLGTCMWIIDRLALRVGGEKDDDEADTVGCCSLRVEHLTFVEDALSCEFKFLGKDSMLYHETIGAVQGVSPQPGRKVRRPQHGTLTRVCVCMYACVVQSLKRMVTPGRWCSRTCRRFARAR